MGTKQEGWQTEKCHTEFGKVLRTKRKEAGKSLTEVARSIGKTQSYLSQLEVGTVKPPRQKSADTIQALADAIGCNSQPLYIAADIIPKNMHDKILKAFVKNPERTEAALNAGKLRELLDEVR